MKIKDNKDYLKIHELVQRGIEIENELISLDSIIKKLSDGNCSPNIKIQLNYKEEGKRENILDSDGSIKPEYLDPSFNRDSSRILFYESSFISSENSRKYSEIDINKDLPDYIIMEIVGVYYSHLYSELKAIKKQLNQYKDETN